MDRTHPYAGRLDRSIQDQTLICHCPRMDIFSYPARVLSSVVSIVGKNGSVPYPHLAFVDWRPSDVPQIKVCAPARFLALSA